MALTRLPVQYRTYWPLIALGLPRQFHSEKNMKAALEDKNSNLYRNFIEELRIVFARDERLYNFVCERVPPDSLDDMFAGVVGNAKQKHFCEGIDCRFSYKNIGEKADVVGYCLWCDSDKMQKAMETRHPRACHVK